MKQQGPLILICLTLVGLLLAYGSERLMPLGFGVTVLWLGVLVVANGSIWFGAWGVVAGMFFPFLAGRVQGLEMQDCALAVLPNLLEGLIPAYAFRRLAADPALHDRRSVKAYALWAAVVPSLAGGWLGAGSWLLVGKADRDTFLLLAIDWSLSNMVVLAVLGFPAAYLLTPALRERDWLVRGWWG